MFHLFAIAFVATFIARTQAATGPVVTGYYNVFAGYSIKGFGCLVTDPSNPVTVSSWNLGQCQPYMTSGGMAQTIISMSTDSLTVYMDVYSSTDCTGTSTATYKTTLQEPTKGCTWSYTTISTPPIQESATTLAKVNMWDTINYYTSSTLCDSKATPAFVYQSQVPVGQTCEPGCFANTNDNGFVQYSQECVYNPLYVPSYSPVPTIAPTVKVANNDAIIAGAVVGGVLLLALLAGLYYCYAGGGKTDDDEFESLRTDRA